MERNCIEHFNFAVQILWLNSDRAYYSRDAKRAKKKKKNAIARKRVMLTVQNITSGQKDKKLTIS